ADVEDTARPPCAQESIERQQASARGPVMTGAERQRSFNLEAEAMRWNSRAIVRAMDHEPAGTNRLQPGEARRHPVARRDGFEAQFRGGGVAGNGLHQIANLDFIRRTIEMDFDRPPAPLLLEGRDRGAE